MIRGANSFSVEDVPRPIVDSDEVLARVRAVGICQTDIEIAEGNHPFANKLFKRKDFCLIPGHEWSGEVIEVGENCEGLEMDDRVVSEVSISCGKCYYCINKRGNLCDNLQEVGITRNGAIADYISLPCRIIHKIPHNIPFKNATLIEPTAVVIHAINRIFQHEKTVDVSLDGKVVAIFGDGPIGLLTLQVIKNMNPSKIYLIGKSDVKLRIGRLLGCDACVNIEGEGKKDIEIIRDALGGEEVDVVMEAAGNGDVINQAFEVVRRGGVVVLIGLHRTLPIDVNKVVLKELDVKGSLSSPGVWDEAIRLVSEGKIRTSELITHEFSLLEADRAVEYVRRDKASVVKAIININS